MKYIALGISMLFFSNYSNASSAEETTTKPDSVKVKHKIEHQVFVNTTFFIKQIVNLSDNSLAISPYILGYKCFFTKHDGIRLSVGGSFNDQKTFPDPSSVSINDNTTANARLGYEYHRSLGKYWTFFFGADALYDINKVRSVDNSDEDIITTRTTTWDFGFGPVVGIQINIGKHVSLFTETAFYYTYGKTKAYVNSINDPEENINMVTAVNTNGQFLLPTSLYFVFRF